MHRLRFYVNGQERSVSIDLAQFALYIGRHAVNAEEGTCINHILCGALTHATEKVDTNGRPIPSPITLEL